MKKRLLFGLVLTSCFITACSTEIPLDDSNTEVVAEYVSDLLLRYGSDTQNKLVYVSPSIEPSASPSAKPTESTSKQETPTKAPTKDDSKPATPVPSKSPTASTSDGKDDNKFTVNTTPVSIEKIYGQSDVEFTIKSREEYDSYPKNASAYSLTAKDGYKVLIITMTAKNTGDKTAKLELDKSNVTYKLCVEDKWYSSLNTILENDAQYLDVSLAPGKTTDFIIAFEVEEKANTKGSTMVLLQDTNSCEINVK